MHRLHLVFLCGLLALASGSASGSASASGSGSGSASAAGSVVATVPVSQGTAPISIGPAFSALWFDPARDGEGWALEILNADTALGFWFTYDEQGDQRWLIGVGTIAGNRIHFAQLVETTGAQFGPGFDPDTVLRRDVGSVDMEFDDCHRGRFTFAAFGQQMSIDLVRLTETLRLGCDPGVPVSDDGRGLQSGAWFDPSHNGEGFELQWVNAELAVLTWFTFDSQGRPYWIQGVGELIDGRLRFAQMHATRGARFGAAFDPAQVQRFPWGELSLQIGCNSGSADYQSLLPEFGSGHFDLVRLTVLTGLQCPPAIGEIDWQALAANGPRLSEMPAVALDGFIYLGGGLSSISSNSAEFWRYQPGEQRWTRLANLPAARDHGMMAAHGGMIYYFGGNSRALSGASNLVWRFDPGTGAWSGLAPMPAARSAGGAVALGEHIYVAGGGRSAIDRYTPASNSWQTIAIEDSVSRDHASVVVYEEEIWVLGGRPRIDPSNTDAVLIFNPQTGVSRIGPPMTSGRSGFGSGVVGGYLVAAGGEDASAQATLADAEAYSPATGWRRIRNLALGVHGAGAAVVQGSYYLLLGSTQGGGVNNPGRVQVLPVLP